MNMKTRKLSELAKVIRSKNAGPFELTFDVMFDDPETYALVRDSGVLGGELMQRLYRVGADEVLSTHFFDAALSFKATIARKVGSGTVGDTDVFGAQQHAPLLDVEISLPADPIVRPRGSDSIRNTGS
jgi:hypothetical protein